MGQTRFIWFAANRGLWVTRPMADRLVHAARYALPTDDGAVARRMLAADLALLADLNVQITAAEVELARLVPASPFAPLTTVSGWGIVRAGTYGAALGDPARWSGPQQGLLPAPPWHLPAQAALCFTALLRQDRGEGLSPPLE
ncbi:MAG: hypothetical protein ACOH2F_06855 [Cellulomonas sp.]